MDVIIKSINTTFKISKEVQEKFISCLHPIKIPKKTILINPSKRDNNIYFVEKGIARAFNLIDGKEVTSWFSKEGDLLYSTNSFHGKVEGYENEAVQALEDSILYYITISKFEELCRTNVEIANWMRLVQQKAFIEMERRLIYRLYMSAEERYKDLMEKNPDLFKRVNLGYIASYLGMSHVTLCALRK
nr:Crp/Fnr family transcriptional regulator [Parabacteroides goldsteinii]